MTLGRLDSESKYLSHKLPFVQLAAAVEYTDCILAEV